MNSKANDRGGAYIPALTGIRGVAALWVALYHFASNVGPGLGLSGSDGIWGLRSGYLGVDLFFILSGFVLMMTHGVRMEGIRPGIIGGFARNRVFRILPLNAVLLLALAGARAIWPDTYWGPGPFTFAAFIACLLLVQGWLGMALAWNTPAWSLSAEWLAYVYFVVAAPVMNRFSAPRHALAVMAAAFAALVAAMAIKPPLTIDHAEMLGLVRCGAEFTVGLGLCQLWRHRKLAANWQVWLGLALVGCGLVARPAEFAVVPGFALLILASAGEAPLASALFGNRLSHFLGEISFSLYLVNVLLFRAASQIALDIGERTAMGQALLWLSLPALIAVSTLLYRLVEMPCHQIGRRLGQRAMAGQEAALAGR